MIMSEARKEIEKSFHDHYIKHKSEVRARQSVFYHPYVQSLEMDYILRYAGDLKRKEVLIYGVGAHLSLIRNLVRKGAWVTAIDISAETIQLLKKGIRENCLNNAMAVRMDCENLTFGEESFDVIIGRSIIHHLDIEIAIREIRRVLRDGGRGVFLEPLGTNPLIELYRRFTPSDRTPDEHPLLFQDLRLFEKHFSDVQCKFMHAMTGFAYLIRFLDIRDCVFSKIFDLFHKVDNFLLSHVPFYQRLCWDVIFSFTKVEV